MINCYHIKKNKMKTFKYNSKIKMMMNIYFKIQIYQINKKKKTFKKYLSIKLKIIILNE